MKIVDLTSENRIADILYKLLTLAYLLLILLFVFRADLTFAQLMSLFTALMMHFLRHSLKDDKRLLIFLLIGMTIAEFSALIYAFHQSATSIENTVFVLFTADIVIRYKVWYAASVAYIGYFIYLFLWSPDSDFVFYATSMLNHTILIVPMWATKFLLLQRETILALNSKLIEQSNAIEEIAMLKERNRIAGAVHDTLGHTLTTAIVALEVAHLLFDKRPDEAHEKINIAKDELKKGLGDIRGVVKALKMHTSIDRLSLEDEIKGLIETIEKQTEIHIVMDYDLEGDLVSLQQHVLLNGIKEAITNAIKHGKADKIKICLDQGESILVHIIDNGLGCQDIQEGFGLSTMKSRVEAIGGALAYTCLNKGFQLEIQLPIIRGDEDE